MPLKLVTGPANAEKAAVVLDDPHRVDTDLTRLQNVTAEEVQRAVRTIFTEQNRLVLECLPEATKGATK